MKHSLENISEESCNGCGACYQKCPKNVSGWSKMIEAF